MGRKAIAKVPDLIVARNPDTWRLVNDRNWIDSNNFSTCVDWSRSRLIHYHSACWSDCVCDGAAKHNSTCNGTTCHKRRNVMMVVM